MLTKIEFEKRKFKKISRELRFRIAARWVIFDSLSIDTSYMCVCMYCLLDTHGCTCAERVWKDFGRWVQQSWRSSDVSNDFLSFFC